MFSFSVDRGQFFSNEENVGHNIGDSSSAQITTNGDNVYLVWYDVTLGNLGIWFSSTSDKGLSFSELDNITNNKEISLLPQIDAVD